ncbi:hypothetical protein AB0I68_13065 [Streptomyces sp. NPDC050448]|uniref:hypothetical protein n=1 Tax=Streptomyces sp. NPDC050448 TaxID=3155404 RepID=UPI0034327F66
MSPTKASDGPRKQPPAIVIKDKRRIDPVTLELRAADSGIPEHTESGGGHETPGGHIYRLPSVAASRQSNTQSGLR